MSDNADDGGAVRRSHKKYVQTLMASGRTTLSDWCQTMPRMAARSGVRRRGTGVGASAQAPVVQPKAHRPPLTPSSPARLPLPQLLTRLPRLPELPHPPPWNPPAETPMKQLRRMRPLLPPPDAASSVSALTSLCRLCTLVTPNPSAPSGDTPLTTSPPASLVAMSSVASVISLRGAVRDSVRRAWASAASVRAAEKEAVAKLEILPLRPSLPNSPAVLPCTCHDPLLTSSPSGTCHEPVPNTPVQNPSSASESLSPSLPLMLLRSVGRRGGGRFPTPMLLQRRLGTTGTAWRLSRRRRSEEWGLSRIPPFMLCPEQGTERLLLAMEHDWARRRLHFSPVPLAKGSSEAGRKALCSRRSHPCRSLCCICCISCCCAACCSFATFWRLSCRKSSLRCRCCSLFCCSCCCCCCDGDGPSTLQGRGLSWRPLSRLTLSCCRLPCHWLKLSDFRVASPGASPLPAHVSGARSAGEPWRWVMPRWGRRGFRGPSGEPWPSTQPPATDLAESRATLRPRNSGGGGDWGMFGPEYGPASAPTCSFADAARCRPGQVPRAAAAQASVAAARH
mmetsp:Transcript_6227/g.17880  ORF Transcript_6227/g.17880 Transcript_6227/m.17880 type:complete len:564 (+) Transcript_6227:764-2455(+)